MFLKNLLQGIGTAGVETSFTASVRRTRVPQVAFASLRSSFRTLNEQAQIGGGSFVFAVGLLHAKRKGKCFDCRLKTLQKTTQMLNLLLKHQLLLLLLLLLLLPSSLIQLL